MKKSENKPLNPRTLEPSNPANAITVIIAALNEERHLAEAVAEAVAAAADVFDDYEIIVVNDGSRDRTGVIADDLAGRNLRIRAVHHKRPQSLGGVYKKGLSLARMDYVTMINGKNDTTAEELRKIWRFKGQADIIIPYSSDSSYRPISRRIVSVLFTSALNLLFGLRLRYYNHFVLHRLALVRTITIRTDSYAFQGEILVKLLLRGHSYLEISHNDKSDNEGRSKALKPGNLLGVIRFFFHILYDVYLGDEKTRRKTAYDDQTRGAPVCTLSGSGERAE